MAKITEQLSVMTNEWSVFIEGRNGLLPSYDSMIKLKEWLDNYLKIMKSQDDIDFSNQAMCREIQEESNNLYSNVLLDKRKNKEGRRPCHIYIVKDFYRGIYKIGRARNVSNRITQLKTANAGIDLVSYYPGFENDEIVLHSVFEEFRINGEWFFLNEENLQYIESYFTLKSQSK